MRLYQKTKNYFFMNGMFKKEVMNSVKVVGLHLPFQNQLTKATQFETPAFYISIYNCGLYTCFPPILSAHYGSVFFGKENGVLLGFCVGIPCVTFACWKLYIDGWRDDED